MKKTLLSVCIVLSSVFFFTASFITVSAQACPSEPKSGDTLYPGSPNCEGKCSGSCYLVCNPGYSEYDSSACTADPSEEKAVHIYCNGVWVAGETCPRKECLSKGMVWEPLTSKCVSPAGTSGGSSGGNNGSGFSVGGNGSASGAQSTNGILNILKLLQSILNYLAPLLIGLALLSFFWFIVLFIWKGADNAAERDKMKHGILWSILAIFVMVSIWGIVAFIGGVTGIQQGGSINGFKLPGQQ